MILKERKTQYQNLLLSKVLLRKVCELIEKTPSLWLGKVTDGKKVGSDDDDEATIDE